MHTEHAHTYTLYASYLNQCIDLRCHSILKNTRMLNYFLFMVNWTN